MVGQTTLEQAKTVLSMSRILSQATKVRYKCVDFLGMANHMANCRHGHLHHAIASVTGGLR